MVKESARSTREHDSEPSAKPKPSKMLGDLKAREENAASSSNQSLDHSGCHW